MNYNKFALIEPSLKEEQHFLTSLNSDVSFLIAHPETQLPDIKDLSNITHFALFYHYQPLAPFFPAHDKDCYFRTFSKKVVDYIKELKQQNGTLTWDIITCNFQDPYVIQKLKEFEQETGIIVRYSIDETGNNPQGDWILESHNVDIKSFYFNDGINSWEGVLSAWWFGYEESRLYDYYVKLKYSNGSPTGELERIHTQVDSTGKPLYVQYDDNYKNITFDTPGSIKFAPDGGSYYGTSPTGTNYVGLCTSYYACALLEPLNGALRATSKGHASYGGAYGGSYGAADANAVVVVDDVDVVVASRYAFCALKTDGSVLAWGFASYGGEISDETTRNAVMGVGGNPPADPVVKVFGKEDGFCAITQSGKIYAWGNSSYGGVIPSEIVTAMETRQAVTVYHNERHFMVLCSNGDCYFWGQTTNSGRSDVNGGGAIPNVSYVACSRYGFVTVDGDGNAIGTMFGSYYSSYNDTYLPNMTNMKMLWMLKGNYSAVWLKNDGTLHTTGSGYVDITGLESQMQPGENIVQFGNTYNVKYIVTDAGNVYFNNAYLDGLASDEFTGKVVSVFPGRNAYVRTTDQKIYQVFATGSYPYYSGDWRAPQIYTADAGKEIAIHFGNWDNGNNSSWIYTDGTTGTASKYDKDKYAPAGRTVYITGGYSDYAFLQNDTDAIASFPNVAAGASGSSSGGGGGGGDSAPAALTEAQVETNLDTLVTDDANITTAIVDQIKTESTTLASTIADDNTQVSLTAVVDLKSIATRSSRRNLRKQTLNLLFAKATARKAFKTTAADLGISTDLPDVDEATIVKVVKPSTEAVPVTESIQNNELVFINLAQDGESVPLDISGVGTVKVIRSASGYSITQPDGLTELLDGNGAVRYWQEGDRVYYEGLTLFIGSVTVTVDATSGTRYIYMTESGDSTTIQFDATNSYDVTYDGTSYTVDNIIDNGTLLSGAAATTAGAGTYAQNDTTTITLSGFTENISFSLAGSSSGDPHVFPMFGNIYELPNKVASYRMLQGEEIIMNTSTRKVTEQEANQIKQYYTLATGSDAPSSLLTDGVFYSKIYLEADGHKFYYNFDSRKGIASDEHYFKLSIDNTSSKNKFENTEMVQGTLSFNHSVYGLCKVQIKNFKNPQVKYGLGFNTTSPSGLRGLIVREYDTQSAEVESLKSTESVEMKLGKNKVLSYFN